MTRCCNTDTTRSTSFFISLAARMNSPRRELAFAAEDPCDAEVKALNDCEDSNPGCNNCLDKAHALPPDENGCYCASNAAIDKCYNEACSTLDCSKEYDAFHKCDEANPLPDDDANPPTPIIGDFVDVVDEGEDGDDDDDCVCPEYEGIFAVNA